MQGGQEFLYIVPLKQGLKQIISTIINYFPVIVFIHSSIKTRIETNMAKLKALNTSSFLYIVPLKQGLKQMNKQELNEYKKKFLYIVPLKQGLKPNSAIA